MNTAVAGNIPSKFQNIGLHKTATHKPKLIAHSSLQI
jgi:hypothetical protein